MTMSNTNDTRAGTARYYDVFQTWASDIRYYLGLVGARDSVLELGCGTGRVVVALAERARRVVGIDHSEDMLGECRRKLAAMALTEKASVVHGDITRARMSEQFDHVLAPFHVLQNLFEEMAVDDMLATVLAHLSPGGTAVLTSLAPVWDPEELVHRMQLRAERRLVGQAFVGNDLVRRYESIVETTKDPLVVWVEQEYECFSRGRLVDRVSMTHSMRMWYPAELEAKVEAAGFEVMRKDGGYQGEAYGKGGSLILHLRARKPA